MNFPRRYTLTADIAPGQTITDLRLLDYLDENQQYIGLDSATAGYILEDQPLAGAAQNPPGNDLILRWASITVGRALPTPQRSSPFLCRATTRTARG